ncbi:MAG: hypothetical protein COV76_05560 [Candidatus Omnitrophica bacterium CG11_big_fil_rev_8_21_14_0_20_64_10]|nr:MAG: hypothetical protein COV76_05560 [Candidatus Omnitrophica bacterium CG11_big_fil_rev_8_21_14_0_20_64_10]
MKNIRLGDIQFLNSWPVTGAIKMGALRRPITLVSETPARLNQRLLAGELTASAISAFKFLEHQDELVPVPGFCIRADGPVASVLLVSRKPLEKLRDETIGVSNQGATTPVLLKILLERKKLHPTLETTPLRFPEILDHYPAALLIGDEALTANQEIRAGLFGGDPSSLYVWDLGQVWARWTRLPAVFALWAVRRSVAETDPELPWQVGEILCDSYEWGLRHERQMLAAMRRAFPWEGTFLMKYLSGLAYELDQRAWKGMLRYALEAESIGELPAGSAERFENRFIRKGRRTLKLKPTYPADLAGVFS